eukprot:TRINITY_DN4384_c0_g6_i1.p1 TRINITY_DN4384_c0_g6~~TRINITY_DN4384_c0_g6_i1.p1  ORF type:complete len:212 (+),score=47.82 TRINITY_DN4384_c0_g6_i1:45-680(+)
MVNCREVEIAGRQLSLWELDDPIDQSTGKSLTGAWIWDAALVVAMWLDTPRWQQAGGTLKGKRVVEVGAGVGAPGIAAAALGAQVVITDRPALVGGIEKNIRENNLENFARAEVLEWGEDCSHLEPPVDVVLGADIMYDIDAIEPLALTLLQLSSTETQIFLACELRTIIPDCFRVLYDHGFRWKDVPDEELHPEWRSSDIKIFQFFRPPK